MCRISGDKKKDAGFLPRPQNYLALSSLTFATSLCAASCFTSSTPLALLWSSFFVTLVAKKYRLATMLPFVPRMVCDSR